MADLDVFEARFGRAYRRYLDEAPTEVDARAVAQAVAAAHPAARSGLLGWRLRPARPLVWVVLAGLLAAALFGAALFLGTHRPVQRNVGLAPTGIGVLTAEGGGYSGLAADGKGVLWARNFGGRVVRFDPSTASGRSWTISDDAAFTSSEIAPARSGGVWLVTGRTVRWFDGTAFREVIEAPGEITVLTEAPDGTLWAAAGDGVLLHWDGASWTRLDPGRPSSNAEITAINVDSARRVWVGWRHPAMYPAAGWVSQYNGSWWVRLDGNDAEPLGGGVSSIAELADGSVWVASEKGLARFDGTSWTDQTPPQVHGGDILSLSAGPNGELWAGGQLGDESTAIGRFDGDAWAWYSEFDGEPAPTGYVGGIVPTEHGLYVGAGDGIYRRLTGGWERAWPPDTTDPTALGILLAISHDELWTTGDRGLWHFLDGSWTYEEIIPDPSEAPTVLTRAPDGTLWAGGRDGVAYRRDGQWIRADAGAAKAIAVDVSGTVWVAGADTRWIGSGGLELWTLRLEGTRWVRQMIEGCPLESHGRPINSLAFDDTGGLWVGISADAMAGWPGGLARFDGRSWETFTSIAGSDIAGAAVLGSTTGGVWVAAHFPYVRPDGVGDVTLRAARYDGTRWTLVEVPDGFGARPMLGPGGTLWASTQRGPARYDGKGWTFPYPGITLTAWTGGVLGWQVAPDGTVFGYAQGVLRFPTTE